MKFSKMDVVLGDFLKVFSRLLTSVRRVSSTRREFLLPILVQMSDEECTIHMHMQDDAIDPSDLNSMSYRR